MYINTYSQQTTYTRYLFDFNDAFKAYDFQYPVNNGSLNGYKDAKSFGTNKHLGCDISGIVDGNSDLGDTIYAIANGKVIFLWEMFYEDNQPGSVIMLLHNTKHGYIVSLYRHCQASIVRWGQYVRKNEPISTFGTDGGMYYAHLHFEIRSNILKGIEGGYGNSSGYLNPLEFINNNLKSTAP